MPQQATIAITPGSGQFLDAVSVVIGGNTVVRETMVIADPTNPLALAAVSIVGSLNVAGHDAVLNTPTDNPFVMAGVDGSGNIQFLPVNGAGGVQAGTNTILIGGVGGGNDANFLPVTLEGTSSAPRLVNIGGIYHTTQPTYSNGQGAQAQSTARGALIVAPGIEPFTVTITGTVNQNIISILGTAPTTAGFLDIKGADGNVFVRQATAANLNATATQGPAASATASWPVRLGAPATAAWSQAAINFSASGANIIIPGVGGQTVRVMRMFFVNSDSTTATNITIQDTTPTSFTGSFRLITTGVFSARGEGEPHFISGVGQGIQIVSSAAVQISGTVWYTQS